MITIRSTNDSPAVQFNVATQTAAVHELLRLGRREGDAELAEHLRVRRVRGNEVEVVPIASVRRGDELLLAQTPPKDGGMRVLRRFEVHQAPVMHDDEEERMEAAALAQLATMRARDGYTRSGTGRARIADRTCYWQRGRMSGGAANVWLDVVDWLVRRQDAILDALAGGARREGGEHGGAHALVAALRDLGAEGVVEIPELHADGPGADDDQPFRQRVDRDAFCA